MAERGYRIFVFHAATDSDWDEKNIDTSMHIYERIDYSVTDIIIIMDEKIKNRTLSNQLITNAKNANKTVIVVDGYYDKCVNKII